jgi:hypothetical protein
VFLWVFSRYLKSLWDKSDFDVNDLDVNETGSANFIEFYFSMRVTTDILLISSWLLQIDNVCNC